MITETAKKLEPEMLESILARINHLKVRPEPSYHPQSLKIAHLIETELLSDQERAIDQNRGRQTRTDYLLGHPPFLFTFGHLFPNPVAYVDDPYWP